MNLLDRFSVSQRLAAGFGVMSLVLLSVCSLGYINITQSQTLIRDSAQVSQRRLALAVEMRSAVQEQDIRIRQIGLLSVPSKIDAAAMQLQVDGANVANAAFGRALQQLKDKPLGPGEETLLKGLVNIDEENKPIAERALGLASSLMTEEAINIINGPLEQISAKRREMTQHFADMQGARVETAYETIFKNGERARSLMLVAAVSGFVAAIVFGWFVSRSIAEPLSQAASLAERVSLGDLAVRLSSKRTDELGQLFRALNSMSTRLRGMVGSIQESSASILIASSEIASGNLDLSQRTERQASSLQTTVATVERMVQSVHRTAESALQARSLAESASQVAGEGGDKVQQVVVTMSRVETSSRRIADIVGVIDAIAFQTNILALNAAVESARAGEQGRGFAVVAGEVRTLAQRSAQAAREIKQLIDENMQTVESSAALVNEARNTMSGIVRSFQKVAFIITEISDAAREQVTGLTNVSQSVLQIDQSTQQNAALVEQSAAAAESLKEQTRSLNAAIGEFRMS